MMNILEAVYLVGVFGTTLYIAFQLFLTMPDDLKSFRKHKAMGNLPEDSSEVVFFIETIIISIFMVAFFPFFWYLEYKRYKHERG